MKRCTNTAIGQALPLFALMLPVLVAMVLMGIEFAERAMQRAMVEDALQQAARSAVQTFEYRTFAYAPHTWNNEQVIRATGDCVRVQAGSSGACAEITFLAQQLFVTNLDGVRGLKISPAELAGRVRWTVLPTGGTCSFSARYLPVTRTNAPLLCAEVHAPLRGMQLLGPEFAPIIGAAETLDPIR